MKRRFHLNGSHRTRPWGWKYVKTSMAEDPTTAMDRSMSQSSVAYEAATRMKDE